MSETIEVMVTVDPEDAFDVLAWYDDQGDRVFSPVNARWLRAYDASSGLRKADIWRAMSPSLQWAVHEFEQRGADHVRAVLAAAADEAPDRRM